MKMIASCISILLRIFSSLAIMFFVSACVVFFIPHELKERQCYINSTQIIKIGGVFYFSWNITLMHKTPKTDKIATGVVFMPKQTTTITAMSKFKINQTYPCYGTSVNTLGIQWAGQWDKPSKFRAFGLLLLVGIILYVIIIILKKVNQSCPQEPTDTQQHQPRTLLITQNRQQSSPSPHNPFPEQPSLEGPPPEWTPSQNLPLQTASSESPPPESPPPSYETAVQRISERQTTV